MYPLFFFSFITSFCSLQWSADSLFETCRGTLFYMWTDFREFPFEVMINTLTWDRQEIAVALKSPSIQNFPHESDLKLIGFCCHLIYRRFTNILPPSHSTHPKRTFPIIGFKIQFLKRDIKRLWWFTDFSIEVFYGLAISLAIRELLEWHLPFKTSPSLISWRDTYFHTRPCKPMAISLCHVSTCQCKWL